MLIKAKQKEEVSRTEHWDSVEGKALVAAKKRAKAAAGDGGGGPPGPCTFSHVTFSLNFRLD